MLNTLNKTHLINEGSSSHVYASNDPNLVIKEFKAFFSPQSRKREIQILQSLKGGDVVQYVHHNDEQLIMERLQTMDLFDLVISNSIPYDQKKSVCRKLIQTLQFIHSKGVVHRDIKLENILIDNKGKVIICDFGFAEMLQTTQVKRFVGTPQYMAPEVQIESVIGTNNSEMISTSALIKADIFSLGVTIFIILLGVPPFINTKGSQKCKYWRLIQQQKWDQYFGMIQKHVSIEISEECRDFLRNMLHYESTQRSGLDCLIQHPFLGDTKEEMPLI